MLKVLVCVVRRVQEQARIAEELLRRQEDLERKAAELDRREREMQSLSASGGGQGAGGGWPSIHPREGDHRGGSGSVQCLGLLPVIQVD